MLKIKRMYYDMKILILYKNLCLYIEDQCFENIVCGFFCWKVDNKVSMKNKSEDNF